MCSIFFLLQKSFPYLYCVANIKESKTDCCLLAVSTWRRLEEQEFVSTYHSTTGYGSRRGVVDIVGFKDDLAVRGHGQSVAVGQCKRSVVVEDRVEIFDPEGIDRSVEYQPYVFTSFCSQRFAPQSRKDSVSPKSRYTVFTSLS